MNIDEVKQAAERWRTQTYRWLRNEFEPRKQQDMTALADFAVKVLSDPSELLPEMVWDVADGEGCKTAFGTYWVWEGNGRWCWCIGFEQGFCTSQEDGRLHCREHLRAKVRELFGVTK